LFLYLQFGPQEAARAASPPVVIRGVVNSYAQVTGIDLGARQLTLGNVEGNLTDFDAGDKVMLIQMKGATVKTADDSTFGEVTDLGSAGHYELATVTNQQTNGGTSVITLDNLVRTYDANGSVQVVSVPQYQDATVDSTLTALAWDSALGYGGIVAVEVVGTLRLEADIDVTGKGFRGGQPNASGMGGDSNDTTYRAAANSRLAQKGEGVASVASEHQFGRGALANGGGGGNNHNAGGGGGSNYTRGGNGGEAWRDGGAEGLAGYAMPYSSTENRIFLGGGGGGGQQNNRFATAGGRGGGIVFMRAGAVTVGCTTPSAIRVSGDSAAHTLGNDAAGGGGAGGVLLVEVNDYNLDCELLYEANGGAGGNVNTQNRHGGGGGGGIGAILRYNSVSNSLLIYEQTPGTQGVACRSCTTNSGNEQEGSAGDPCPPSGCADSQTGWTPPGTPTVLPVELLHFQVKVTDNATVTIRWATATEINNERFVIERSDDGTTFEPLAVQPGAGTVGNRRDYSYVDDAPLPGVSYYRLTQYDYDGASETFEAVSVRLPGAALRISNVAPNPFASQLRVSYRSEEAGAGLIELIDARGGTALTHRFTVPLGGGEEILTGLDRLPTGTYLLRFSVDGQPAPVQKLIKQ
ncbi:MAG: T9SS type A sorting domain-containing protein, partial [Catalinimonas sp.]